MRAVFIIVFLVTVVAGKAQNINFSGCPALFETQDYTFSPEGPDASGRNVYKTTPVNGDQPCGALGTCEFMISWSTASERWEFWADSGNGDFIDPYLIFYNTSPSTPNPPDLTLGVWVENTIITEGNCGGNLTTGNATLTGAVQSTLRTKEFFGSARLRLYPNPVRSSLFIPDVAAGYKVSVSNELGQIVIENYQSGPLDVAMLPPGIYLLRIWSGGTSYTEKFVKL